MKEVDSIYLYEEDQCYIAIDLFKNDTIMMIHERDKMTSKQLYNTILVSVFYVRNKYLQYTAWRCR